MMPDLLELLKLVENAVHNNTAIPRSLLTALMQVGVDQTQRMNPQITREEAVEVYMRLVKEKMKHGRIR